MAYKMMLSRPYDGMSSIWNVSAHVGDAPSCPNNSADVDLVKVLLGEWIRIVQPSIHTSCREVFRVNGQMDINAAYWIRVMNTNHTQSIGFVDAGIISPAQAANYGNDTWSIVRLNRVLHHRAIDVWQNLPNHPQGNGALRSALSRTSP